MSPRTLVQDGESPRDTFLRQTDDLETSSSTYLSMAQQIQAAIVRIRLQDSSMQVAPNLASLEGTQADAHDLSQDNNEYLRANASMLATASSQGESSSHSSGGAPHTADESLSWQQPCRRQNTNRQ